ncbi:hypothetical protein ACP70R_034651 [Stipagrostis hirtigluma subsp. patula]
MGKEAALAVGKEAGVGLGSHRNRWVDSILLSAAADSAAPGSLLHRCRLDPSRHEPIYTPLCRRRPAPQLSPLRRSSDVGVVALQVWLPLRCCRPPPMMLSHFNLGDHGARICASTGQILLNIVLAT